MKRIIYKHKQIWKASIIALVLAAVFALSAENSFNGVKLATGVKFAEMLIFLSVWFQFLNVIFQKGKSRVKKIMQAAIGAFCYGVIITFVWFCLGSRMDQLSLLFLAYVGGTFAIWCVTMVIGNILTEHTVKHSAFSLGMSLLNVLFKFFAYFYAPYWYYCYYSSALGYQYDWRPIFQHLGIWMISALPIAIVVVCIASMGGAWWLMTVLKFVFSTDQEVEESIYEAAECDRLILFTTPEDILGAPNIRMLWMQFLIFNGFASARTRNMAAFLNGRNFVASIQQYVTGQIEGDKFKDKICLLWREERKTLSFNDDQEKKIEEFLAQYENAGFHILICEHITMLENLMEQKIPENILYGKYMLKAGTDIAIPYESITQYAGQKHARDLYLQMHQYLSEHEEDIVLKRSIEKLCLGESVVAQFYNLLKMAEYCIHVRGLYAITSEEKQGKVDKKDFYKFSIGKWNELQRIPKCMIKNRELAEQMRFLDMLCTGKSKSDIKTTAVSYNKICDMISELRNRFVGHGTMLYSVDEQILYPLGCAVYLIVKTYMENPHTLKERKVLIPETNEAAVNAVYKSGKKTYLFCGKDEFENRDYLDYETGTVITLDRTGKNKIDHMKISTAAGMESNRNLTVERKKTHFHGEQKKAQKKFIKKYKCVPIWNFNAKGHWFDQYSEEIKNGYMTKSFFEKEYAEAILHEEVTPQLYHEFLINLEPSKIIMLYDAESWDQIQREWQYEESFESAYVRSILLEGGFVPKALNQIGVLGKTEKEVLNPYPWIRSLDIQRFDTYPAIMSWAVNATGFSAKLNRTSRRRLKEQSQYVERKNTYRRILEETGCESLLLAQNIYIAGFFKNVCEYEDITTSTMALFDFIEFMTQCVQYTLTELTDKELKEDKVSLDLESMGQIIFEYAPKDSVLYNRVHYGSMDIPEYCRKLHKKMKEYLPYEFEGDTTDFLGMMKILRIIRNGTKAHGVIREEHVGVMWALLLYYALILGWFLDIHHFELYISGDKLEAGYTEGCQNFYIDLSEYFTIDKNVPCPIWKAEDGKRKYTNYFYGQYVVPDYVEK